MLWKANEWLVTQKSGLCQLKKIKFRSSFNSNIKLYSKMEWLINSNGRNYSV